MSDNPFKWHNIEWENLSHASKLLLCGCIHEYGISGTGINSQQFAILFNIFMEDLPRYVRAEPDLIDKAIDSPEFQEMRVWDTNGTGPIPSSIHKAHKTECPQLIWDTTTRSAAFKNKTPIIVKWETLSEDWKLRICVYNVYHRLDMVQAVILMDCVKGRQGRAVRLEDGFAEKVRASRQWMEVRDGIVPLAGVWKIHRRGDNAVASLCRRYPEIKFMSRNNRHNS
ncbi:uncharacterized protein KY384_002361 [Bacidia gigantensis]|uniref:uncharacterized protein n=1 Tax=Bacidia gigantensis TaxID=2732470 RepID=UPI001D03796D|nr:uncharacterized protein KY384_002361 [Bacidia gigantensis]KAG8532484.1 hypothetical protein KY384_002361 [Bacidia gigantensis]